MRRLTFAAMIALALALMSVAPALAGGGGDGKGHEREAKINVWCSVVSGTQVHINGDLVVGDGDHGNTTLWLFGSKTGKSWWYAGQQDIIHVVKGQTVYWFSFDAQLDSNHFVDYVVVGDGTFSRVINRDECGFRVPEAPATPLLLLGAFPALGLIAVKASGLRMRLPKGNRIA